ncbi:class I histocompatibility antigen, F10 alpha chain-like isoform X1 [Pygocentrus nattereri]|uniref:Ig-like domain-containing protein n=1 Tax=Pygocentrus nattereri TaxID=42514 RepID=A0A3B4EKD4_PYGNA|nr:class I histocompatibility antigen, F10 alpha chain-like isoform X1 [Pygocentrus nattereri]
MGVSAFICAALLCGEVVFTLGDKHSLYYIYTALSKDVALPGIYEFTALGLLDDRAIDYYNSQEQVKVPKQDWMREKLQPDYWDKGTQSRRSKEQWFKVNVEILMQRMGHNQTNLHVLQWRHGCEIEEANGKPKFLRGIDEYSYDGDEFLSFDDDNMRWIAPVAQALPTKRKWDDVPILNQYTKGYLEKECVDWLTKFMQYGKEALRKHSPPDVHVFAKKCTTDSTKLTLTCLATGFYPKDMVVSLRKYRTALPEHLVKSSGVRPNEDGTHQLRKSVDIQEDEKAKYDCFVNHITLKTPVTKQWVPSSGMVGAVIGGVIVLLLLTSGGIIFALIKKGIIAVPCIGNPVTMATAATALQAPPNGVPEKLMQAGNGAVMTNGTANGHPEEVPLCSNGNEHMHEKGMNGAPASA